MISTGMYGIDDMLAGGIPEGSRVLYSLEPGVDGQLFYDLNTVRGTRK